MATGILNAANTIKASAVSTGQAVLNMARSFYITAAINGAKTAMLGFGRAIAMAGKLSLSAMFSPLGIAIMAIAGVAYLVYSNWSTVGPYFMSLWQTVQNAFAQAWALIQPTLNQLQDALNQSGAINTMC